MSLVARLFAPYQTYTMYPYQEERQPTIFDYFINMMVMLTLIMPMILFPILFVRFIVAVVHSVSK